MQTHGKTISLDSELILRMVNSVSTPQISKVLALDLSDDQKNEINTLASEFREKLSKTPHDEKRALARSVVSNLEDILLVDSNEILGQVAQYQQSL